jgi:uncharacterized protein YukE
MTAGLALKPLAPFAHDWVGGDIDGLSALAGTLYGYVPKMDSVADALDAQVRQLVGTAGWKGEAAAAFTTAWSRDSMTARALGLATDQVGGIVDWLAVSLSMLESELEITAAEAAAHGVAIGPNGMPPEVCFGPPTNAKEAEMQEWATFYQKYYQEVMDQAQQTRSTAASALATTGRQIVGAHSSTNGSVRHVADGGGGGMSVGDDVTAMDLLGDLMASPAAASRTAAKTLDGARSALTSAKEAILKLQKDLGPDTQAPDAMVSDVKSSMSALQSDKAAAEAAEKIDNRVFKVLDYRVENVTEDVQSLVARLRSGTSAVKPPDGGEVKPPDGGAGAGDATDDGLDEVLSKLTDFGKDIPVLDVLAATVGTYLGTRSAMSGPNGQPLDVALPEQAGSNVASLAAGALVGTSVTTAVGGISAVSGLAIGGLAVGGAVAASAGVLAGGIVAVGVGIFASKLFAQNWSQDINEYGLEDGIVYGVGDSLAQTGEDIGHTVAHVWDSIF